MSTGSTSISPVLGMSRLIEKSAVVAVISGRLRRRTGKGDAVETGEQFARPFAVGAGGIGAYVSRSAGGDGVELELLVLIAARFGVPDRDDGLRVDVGARVLEVHRRFEQVVGDLELMDDILLPPGSKAASAT